MAKTTLFANDLLKLIFNAIPMTGLADDAVLFTVTALTVALHTDDPGVDGDQTTFEVDYTGYVRMALARSPDGWVVTNNEVSPTNNIDFPASTGGAATTATYVSIGTGVDDKMLYKGPLIPPIYIAPDAPAPRVTTATTVSEG